MTEQASNRSRGLIYILAATAIAGALGYLIQLLAPAMLTDAEDYLTFSVFWSALHLAVAGISGVQQEVTRATRTGESATSARTLLRFGLAAAAVLAVVAVAVGLFIAPRVFPDDVQTLSLWFAVGVFGNLLLAILAGVLYGLGNWPAIASLTVIDAVLRGALVAAGLLLHFPATVLAAFVALPFGAAAVVVWSAVRARTSGRYRLDVDVRRLLLHTGSTVVAASATGVMVTGLPLLLRLALPEESAVVLASLILVITITRAPLIIPLIALQSFLIIHFRAAVGSVWRSLLLYLGVAAAVTALAAVAAALLGPPIIDFIAGGSYDVSPPVAAAVVVSAGGVAMLCLTGPALLSQSRHMQYVAGWLAAALSTIAALFLPLPTMSRVAIALLLAPAIGLVVHVLSIHVGRPRSGPQPNV